MAEQQHPITPPTELVEQWLQSTRSDDCIGAYPEDYEYLVAIQAARWGADTELEACVEWMRGSKTPFMPDQAADQLRAARRPQPKSLAEKSLDLIDKIQSNKKMWQIEELDVVRRALERLQELEGQGDG